MKHLLSLICLLSALSLQAQTFLFTGEIADDKANRLTSAVAVLLNPSDSTMQYYAITGSNGRFEIRNIKNGSYLLQISLLGYNTLYRRISIPLPEGEDAGTFILIQKVFKMDDVTVTGERIPIRIKKDTLEYDARSYKVKTDGVAEDLLRNLPGIEVDRSGNVKAMGENVKNVLVDGKEFFSGDPKVATKNLPADAIKKVQLFNKKSEESQFTGIDDGLRNPTVNLVLEENKKTGIFGNVEGGAGTGDHATTGAKVYRFTKQTQFAALGMYNNINQYGFSLGDYINYSGGLSSFSDHSGRIALAGDNDFPVDYGQPVYGKGSNGAAGLNFSVSGSPNDRILFSYLGNGSSRDLTGSSISRNFIPEGSYRTDQTFKEQKRDSTHRISFGLRKMTGEKQNIIINGGFGINSNGNPVNLVSGNFLNNEQQNLLQKLSAEQNSTISGNADALYLLKVNEGRTIFRFSGKADITDDNSRTRFNDTLEYLSPYQMITSSQFYNFRSSSGNYSAGTSLSLRLSKLSFAEFSVKGGLRTEYIRRKQGDLPLSVPDPALSPGFMKHEEYIRPAISWKRGTQISQLILSIGSEAGKFYTSLNHDDPQLKSYFYLNPQLSWEYDYRSGRRLNLSYSSVVNTPAAYQLLPVVNNLNPLILSYGNRDLKPEQVNEARMSWWLFDQFSFTSFLASLSMTYTKDKINIARNIDDKLNETVSLVNVRDDYAAGADLDFATPIKPLGVRINFDLSERFNRGISIINNTENINTIISHRLSLKIDNRKKEKWDIEAGTAVTITGSRYSVQNSFNNVYSDISWFSEISYTPGIHFNIKASADITNYSARSFSGARLIPLAGAEASWHFMKYQRGSLTLTATDLLNRNTGLQRLSEINYLTERRTDMLGRYFLLSFRYRLNRNGGNKGSVDIQVRKR